MVKVNLIYRKIDYKEALSSKRDLLILQKYMINIEKRITNYYSLRLDEIRLKAKLYKKIKETHLEIKKLQEELPKSEHPKFKSVKPTSIEKLVEKKMQHKKEDIYEDNLERELREIQDKLKKLRV